MKKTKVQKQFFEELEKVPIVQVACEKVGISRNSVYKWRKQDSKFAKQMDISLITGVALVNDMSESKLLTLIKEKNYPAISFWLRHRNDNYKNKLEIITKDDDGQLTPAQTKIVKEALKRASLIEAQSINNINTKNHE